MADPEIYRGPSLFSYVRSVCCTHSLTQREYAQRWTELRPGIGEAAFLVERLRAASVAADRAAPNRDPGPELTHCFRSVERSLRDLKRESGPAQDQVRTERLHRTLLADLRSLVRRIG